MENFKKAKNLLFKVELEGVGVINFDSSDARWIVKKLRQACRKRTV